MKRLARLIRLVRLDEARPELPSNTLFHAGPPYRGGPPAAVMTAATQAAMIGGLADNAAAAREMIMAGHIVLRPAQDFGVAVPLAQVLAPSMWCFEVGDDAHRAYSPVSEGPPPALRFGSDDPGCLERARGWCSAAAASINPLLAQVPDPETLMHAALEAGDDCHAMTAAGNTLFVNALAGLSPQMRADLLANPSFVLGVWMAWSAWKVQASESPISAIGGNGIEFGWRLRGNTIWSVAPATPPVGKYFQPELASQALGAIGDSALVDTCGFGGQALQHAPALLEEWAAVLPADVLARRKRIVDPASGLIDLERIRASNTAPIIHLAILNSAGGAAPIGRGFYCPPITLFQ
ncbi:MAG: DUF1116 domain-containing protein [Polaromonas sp.]